MGLGNWIDPCRTALLIVDMQADFASPNGALGRAGVDISATSAALDAAGRLASAARAAGAALVFVALRTAPDSDSAAWAERLRRRGQGELGGGLCRAGEAGAAFVGPVPDADDLIVAKTRYSGFFGTDLDAQLRRRGIDTLVICGLTTECCVDSTVRDAFQLDYHLFLVGDACAAYEADLHRAALRALEINCAILVTTDQIVAAWGGGDLG